MKTYIKKCPFCEEQPETTQYQHSQELYVKHSCKNTDLSFLIPLSVWNKRPIEDKLIQHCSFLFQGITLVWKRYFLAILKESTEFMKQFYPEEDK
jgi:hypothetical protein